MQATKFIYVLATLTLINNNYTFAASFTGASCVKVTGALIKMGHLPLFIFDKSKNTSDTGYPMTHTHFFISNSDGTVYKIVMDNLYYTQLSSKQAQTNANVDLIQKLEEQFKVGDQVAACGKEFKNNQGKLGIHFVHPSDCSTTKFNGFLKINGTDLTSDSKYCSYCACKISYGKN